MSVDQERADVAGQLARIEASLARIEASQARTEQVCEVLLEAASPYLRGRARLAVLTLLAGRRRT